MFARLGAKIIEILVMKLLALIPMGIRYVSDRLKRRKRNNESQEAARKVEDAKTLSDVRNSVDDLP